MEENRKRQETQGGFNISSNLKEAADGLKQQGGETVEQILVDQIRPNRYQPRIYFDPQQMEELTADIKHRGILQPVIVRVVNEVDSGENFELAAGERRWRAAKAAGFSTIPALIRQLSDGEMKEIAFIENDERASLTVFERMRYISQRFDEIGNAEDVARRFSIEKPTVEKYIRIYKRITVTAEFEKTFMKHQKTIDFRTATSFASIANKIAVFKADDNKSEAEGKKNSKQGTQGVRKDNRQYIRYIEMLDKGKIKDALPKLLRKFGESGGGKTGTAASTSLPDPQAARQKGPFIETDEALILTVKVYKHTGVSQAQMEAIHESLDAFTARMGDLYAQGGKVAKDGNH